MNKQVDPDKDFPKEDPFDLGALPDDEEIERMSKEKQLKKNIFFLKIHKKFIKAILTGIMSLEQVNRIAEKSWEIEELLLT